MSHTHGKKMVLEREPLTILLWRTDCARAGHCRPRRRQNTQEAFWAGHLCRPAGSSACLSPKVREIKAAGAHTQTRVHPLGANTHSRESGDKLPIDDDGIKGHRELSFMIYLSATSQCPQRWISLDYFLFHTSSDFLSKYYSNHRNIVNDTNLMNINKPIPMLHLL